MSATLHGNNPNHILSLGNFCKIQGTKRREDENKNARALSTSPLPTLTPELVNDDSNDDSAEEEDKLGAAGADSSFDVSLDVDADVLKVTMKQYDYCDALGGWRRYKLHVHAITHDDHFMISNCRSGILTTMYATYGLLSIRTYSTAMPSTISALTPSSGWTSSVVAQLLTSFPPFHRDSDSG